MDDRTRVREIMRTLRINHPKATTALNYKNPLELLVATILSAQCTDKRVNIVTEKLFKRYRTAEDYASADVRELEAYIKSTGFYRNKAKNIINCARMLVDEYGSMVPQAMEDLVKLPGVARKTANVVLGHAFGKNEGIAVDTHMRRLSARLGFTENTDPEKIEQDLMRIVAKESWTEVTDLLVLHGRSTCVARKPRCGTCAISGLCPSAGTFG
jgi:endonuclease-3